MGRREFLKSIFAALAALPFINWFTGKAEATPEPERPSLFDSRTLNNLVKEKFEQSNEVSYPFFSRAKKVMADDVEIAGYGALVTNMYVADLITDDSEATVTEAGRFAVTGGINSIPNIKIGSRISQSMLNREYQMRKNIEISESQRSLLKGYTEQLAENLATGLMQTINRLMLTVMLGGEEYDKFGIKLRMKVDVPESVHIKGDWSKPLTTIKNHLGNMQTKFGENPDRMTLGTPAYKELLKSSEFQDAYATYRKENRARFEEYIESYRAKNAGVEPSEFQVMMHFTPSVLNKELGVTAEVYDMVYRVRHNDGRSTSQRYLPENKILFSSSNQDNSYDYDFAHGVVSESVVSSLIRANPVFGQAADAPEFGPYAYFTGNMDLNPPDVKAWAVVKGLPRLHNKTAFSSITI